ncbi:C-C motif chemokine 20b [Clinocottus analis]|uniref:C-C motif chemokine 20b n=1 Tax=Clinocottus analis TaxID=304258 RepID=UPI0035C02929
MASCRVCLPALLCSLVILSSFIGSTQSASCCMMYTSRPLRCQRLMGYTIQTIINSCDINAVIFHLPGRFLCADPSSKWTLRGMKCVDERRRKTSWMTVKTNTTSA